MKLTDPQRRALGKLLDRADNPGTTLGFIRVGTELRGTVLWNLRRLGLAEIAPWDTRQYRITHAGRAALEE